MARTNLGHSALVPAGCFIIVAALSLGASAYFAAYSPADPFQAMALLRSKIRCGLATRYLVEAHGRRVPDHDRLQGHIAYGGVVVDGSFVSFEELWSMLEAYEGFQFLLTIADPYDEL